MLQYLYALVEGLPRGWRPPPGGIGSAAVAAHPVKDLVLVESPVAVAPVRTPRNLALHHDILATLLDARAVLPFGFGTVVEARQVEAWLAERLPGFRARLAEVRGRVEMTIRLLQLAPGGADLRAVAGQLVERAGVSTWRYRTGGNATASLAFLLRRDEVPVLLARIAPLVSRAAGMAVVPTGPWPPSSFVSDAEPPLAAA